MTKRDKILIASAMNTLNEVADSLVSVPEMFSIRCLLDDEVVVQLREKLLAEVECEWRDRARKAA